MAINLTKGQRISLKKEGGTLKKVRVGLGWDPVTEQKSGSGGFLKKLFSAATQQDVDCDASVLLLNEAGKLPDSNSIVYYGNLRTRSGSVVHQGDNLTGEGEGDDEVVVVDLPAVESQYHRLVFVVNIYNAKERSQHFGMIQNAFIRIVDEANGQEMCRYQLSEGYDNMTALTAGELAREGSGWKFGAVGEASQDSLKSLMQRYQ